VSLPSFQQVIQFYCRYDFGTWGGNYRGLYTIVRSIIGFKQNRGTLKRFTRFFSLLLFLFLLPLTFKQILHLRCATLSLLPHAGAVVEKLQGSIRGLKCRSNAMPSLILSVFRARCFSHIFSIFLAIFSSRCASAHLSCSSSLAKYRQWLSCYDTANSLNPFLHRPFVSNRIPAKFHKFWSPSSLLYSRHVLWFLRTKVLLLSIIIPLIRFTTIISVLSVTYVTHRGKLY